MALNKAALEVVTSEVESMRKADDAAYIEGVAEKLLEAPLATNSHAFWALLKPVCRKPINSATAVADADGVLHSHPTEMKRAFQIYFLVLVGSENFNA